MVVRFSLNATFKAFRELQIDELVKSIFFWCLSKYAVHHLGSQRGMCYIEDCEAEIRGLGGKSSEGGDDEEVSFSRIPIASFGRIKQKVTLFVDVQFIQNLNVPECGVSVSAAANLTRILLL